MMKYNKLLFFIYTFLDVLFMIITTAVALTTGTSGLTENDSLIAIRCIEVCSWVLLLYELFYFIYRIRVLYRKSKHRGLWSGIVILLIILTVMTNIPIIASMPVGSMILRIANILALVTWIYDIKLIFLDD